MIAGLRIDVDTYRGTKLGVPALVRVLAEYDTRASFFFSVGPDNMGRHLWRLLRPAFFAKMLRSDAAGLYGWDILLRGTLWPGPRIGERLGPVIRAAADAGHEVGLHAWDHHAWQAHLERFSQEEVRELTRRGVEALRAITGAPPTCSAAAGWRCNADVLRAQAAFEFTYQSDCRGESIFYPEVDGRPLDAPQIPVTLPTYDELIGSNGVTDANYNEVLLERFDPDRLNVLTIHAEVEGVARADLFRDFLERARRADLRFLPLVELLPAEGALPVAPLVVGALDGREGDVAFQGATTGSRPVRAGVGSPG